MKKLIIIVTLGIISIQSYSQGNALHFDGTDDEICATVPTLSGDDISIQLWAKPGTSQVDYANIVDTHTAGGIGYTIEQNLNSTNEYYFAWGSGSGAYNIPLTFNLTPSIWQHLTIVKSGTTIEIYIDGLLTQTASGGNATLDPGTSLRIGNWILEGRNWSGCLDEVRIWDKALTSAEILSNYNTELIGNEADLILYYNFNNGIANGDNGSGCPGSLPCEDSVNDESPTNNTGELKNFALTGNTSNLVLGFSESTLPVNLLSFEAYKRNNEIIIKWKTGFEIANSGFELQYSNNAKSWNYLKFIEAAGFSENQQSYTYLYPISNNTGQIYFRLKQLDFNGNYSISKIISVFMGKEITNIYPNPVKDYLNISEQAGYYHLYSIGGQIIKQGKFNFSKINFSTIKAGIYHLKLIKEKETSIHILVKL